MTSLADLRVRYGLDDRAVAALAVLTDRVAGDPSAPTTVRDPERIREDHLADSLVALELEVVTHAATIADIGSGAGFPGLALALALPGAEVWLVESAARKCAFIASLAAECGAGNALVACERAESWESGRGRFDVVTARALAPLGVVCEYAAPLLREGGSLVAWRGRRDLEDEAVAARAAEELGLVLEPPVAVTPYRGAQHRHLHTARKLGPTPPRFPRRPGMARKRPLGRA